MGNNISDHAGQATGEQSEWNAAAYGKQKRICEKLTNKGLRTALNQAAAMTNEAREAYEDTLRERGETV